MQEGQYESSVPVIADRALQALASNALEPEWEARFEPRSYGFRPGRGCHDAIEAIFQWRKGATPGPEWALDADLAAAFDRIGHAAFLLASSARFRQGAGRQWLTAGVVEDGRFTPTREGLPRGRGDQPRAPERSAARDGNAAGVRYQLSGTDAVRRSGLPGAGQVRR